jgi:hypothetical protein
VRRARRVYAGAVNLDRARFDRRELRSFAAYARREITRLSARLVKRPRRPDASSTDSFSIGPLKKDFGARLYVFNNVGKPFAWHGMTDHSEGEHARPDCTQKRGRIGFLPAQARHLRNFPQHQPETPASARRGI